MAQKQLTPLDMNGNAIQNLPTTPSGANDAASKAYVDSQAGGVTASSTTTFTNKTLTDSTNTVPFRRVVHGATASTARPNATHVEWVGSVAPTNANTTNDTWVDTA